MYRGLLFIPTLNTLVTNCKSLSQIKSLQAHHITSGFFLISHSRTKLIELLATYPINDLRFALSLFNLIPFPITNDYNAILRGISQSPHPLIAISFYRSMLRKKTRFTSPDALTCSFFLKACSRVLDLDSAIQIHSQILRFGFLSDVLLATTLLDLYCKTGELKKARQLFNEMPLRDVPCWTVLISGLAVGPKPMDGLALLNEMINQNLNPDARCFIAGLSACAQLGLVKEGEKIYKSIKESGLGRTTPICNAMMNMYSKCGFVEEAYSIFQSMPCKRDVISYNVIIMALAMNGDARRALDLFSTMDASSSEPEPTKSTYLAALCACNHVGLVDEGICLLKSMQHKNIAPNEKHYACMVDLLGRAGRVREAYETILSSKLTEDVVAWETLLGAAKTYGDIEMAEEASKRLSEMGSTRPGAFVLLSNVYAAQKRWEDVERIREGMMVKEVKKTPSISSLLVGDVMHRFYNGDLVHGECGEIYKKLDEMKARILEIGYVAEKANVLHDIEEEDKEMALWYHSEKLAVAFGLMRVGAKEAIRVMKNIRICGDCHASIKLVSKVYKREIVVRDCGRFHVFKDGLCTCNDYW